MLRVSQFSYEEATSLQQSAEWHPKAERQRIINDGEFARYCAVEPVLTGTLSHVIGAKLRGRISRCPVLKS
jgi:hypothetical protein